MTSDLAACYWPAARLPQAVRALARHSGLISNVAPAPQSSQGKTGGEAMGRAVETAAERLGVAAEAVTTPYGEVALLLRQAGPALLRIPNGEDGRFLLLLAGSRRTVSLLRPDGKVDRLPLETVRVALCHPMEAPLLAEIDQILAEVEVPARRRPRARRALLGQRLAGAPVEAGWLLRLPPGADPWRQARQSGVLRHLLLFIAAYAVQYALFVLSWWLVGRGALQGRLETGWLWAWGLVLLTVAPLQLVATWAQGTAAVRAGAWLKRRLLHGALRLQPDEIRHQGVGQLLGRVIESEAVETLALSGGFLGIVALIELAVAALVLAAGDSGLASVGLLLGWLLLLAMLGWRYYRRRRRWTDARLAMTHDLVAVMVGQRTRLAQEAPQRYHREEDLALADYAATAAAMDRTGGLLIAVAGRGWLVVGLAALAPAFVVQASPAALAVSVGGVLLAWRALRTLAQSVISVSGAVIAWQQVASFYHAAARRETAVAPEAQAVLAADAAQTDAANGLPLLQGRDVRFCYPRQRDPALHFCTFSVSAADRILLTGPSGGGKSTLAALLTGLRRPDGGALLLGGMDRQAIGVRAWRERVTAAPQFHENYVFTGTLAFNLLMGRRWPPRQGDLQEAAALCRELGLGDLLARMPAGLMQPVGESGWRLSYGERSRLYVARALLQGADVLILDESFAALDPETLRHVSRCVLNRAAALILIAHP